MSLELRVRVDGSLGTVEADGEIDVQTASLLKQGIDRVVAGGASVVALNLSKVGFIDSSGLGAILGRHRLIDQAGGRLVVVAPTDQTKRLLTVTGLDGVLQVVPDTSGL